MRRKHAFHATFILCRVLRLIFDTSQPYVREGRQYVLARWTTTISLLCLPIIDIMLLKLPLYCGNSRWRRRRYIKFQKCQYLGTNKHGWACYWLPGKNMPRKKICRQLTWTVLAYFTIVVFSKVQGVDAEKQPCFPSMCHTASVL